jgi:hypothetical protein
MQAREAAATYYRVGDLMDQAKVKLLGALQVTVWPHTNPSHAASLPDPPSLLAFMELARESWPGYCSAHSGREMQTSFPAFCFCRGLTCPTYQLFSCAWPATGNGEDTGPSTDP